MNILKKDRPQPCFSKASNCYEASSDLQKRIGLDLINRISNDNLYSFILDIGMGTGVAYRKDWGKISRGTIIWN